MTAPLASGARIVLEASPCPENTSTRCSGVRIRWLGNGPEVSEGGLDVCVLERDALSAGQLSAEPDRDGANFWDPSEKLYGMFDVVVRGRGGRRGKRPGRRLADYANVLLRKDERWFATRIRAATSTWPVTRADLDPHYDRVEAMIAPQRYPFDDEPYASTRRPFAFKGAAERLGLDFSFRARGHVRKPGPSPGAGEAIRRRSPTSTGCRARTDGWSGSLTSAATGGSKNTLDYILSAQAHGAELRTSSEVKDFEPVRAVASGQIRGPPEARGGP